MKPDNGNLAYYIWLLARCERCSGSGTVWRPYADECPQCHGTGSTKLSRREMDGLNKMVEAAAQGGEA